METEKTTLLQTTLLLAFWYVDLEDQDGSWHWLGAAISLAHGIGLHRAAPYDAMRGCPITHGRRALYRRIWWAIYYREAWLALGFGRPMRINKDDCDVPMLTLDDVVLELKGVPADIRDLYLPPDLDHLTELWIIVLHLTSKLEDVLTRHYRPRRPSLSLSQMQYDDDELTGLQSSVLAASDTGSFLSTLHSLCFKCYCKLVQTYTDLDFLLTGYSAVIIALYRPYISRPPDYLPPAQQRQLQSAALQRAKSCASNTTDVISRLISLEMIDFVPTMVTTVMMSTMQIHLYEYHHSQGLTRQHAYHHINLHMMVLGHLRKTYWAADLQYNLFQECLKALGATKAQRVPPQVVGGHAESGPPSGHASPPGRVNSDHDIQNTSPEEQTFESANAIEDFFVSFNPFVNMPPDFDATSEWDIEAHTPLNLDVH